MDTPKIVLKAKFKKELHRLPATETSTFEDLSAVLKKTFALPSQWRLCYQDDEGDQIHITSTAELKEAFAVAACDGRKSLKVHVIELSSTTRGKSLSKADAKEESKGKGATCSSPSNFAQILNMLANGHMQDSPDPAQLVPLLQDLAPTALPYLKAFLANQDHANQDRRERGSGEECRKGGHSHSDSPDAAPWLKVAELSLPNDFLAVGSAGQAVSKLQFVLIALGHMEPGSIRWAHGIYGPLTQQAVANFQKVNKIEQIAQQPAGEYDAVTRDALQLELILLQSASPSSHSEEASPPPPPAADGSTRAGAGAGAGAGADTGAAAAKSPKVKNRGNYYLLQNPASGFVLHLNGLGDKMVSARWCQDEPDDFCEFAFIGDAYHRDGALVVCKANGEVLHHDGGTVTDRLVSTRYCQGENNQDDFCRIRLLPSDADGHAGGVNQGGPGCAGTYLLQCVADGRFLHLDALGDRLLSTRYPQSSSLEAAQTDDYCQFRLIPVPPAPFPHPATDVQDDQGDISATPAPTPAVAPAPAVSPAPAPAVSPAGDLQQLKSAPPSPPSLPNPSASDGVQNGGAGADADGDNKANEANDKNRPSGQSHPRIKYATQLQLLRGMGFCSGADEEQSLLPLLVKWNGDVNRTVHALCNA